MTPAYLTDDEIAGICDGLRQPAAQRRYLEKTLGLVVHAKPNGKPLLARSEFVRVLGAAGAAAAPGVLSGIPDIDGLLRHLAARKRRPSAL